MNGFENFKQTVEEAKSSIFGEIDALVEEMEASGDVEKFYEKGVKSAAGRLRKGLQSIRKTIHNPTNSKTMATIKDGAKELREELAKK
jgi:hypothetical protein